MDYSPSLLSGLVPEMLQSPHLLPQIFLSSSVSFDLLLSGFLLPSSFSSSLCSKHRAENAEINHFEASLCGWAQPVRTSGLWFISAPRADLSAELWPEKLGGCPPQTAWSTCQRHRVFPGASGVFPAAAQSQTCGQGAGRKNVFYANLASTFSDLTALSGWQSWRNLIDVEPRSQPPDRHF